MRAPPEDDEPVLGSDAEDSEDERTGLGRDTGVLGGERSGSAYY